MHYGNAAFCFYRREIELIQRMRWDSFPSNDGCLWQKGGKILPYTAIRKSRCQRICTTASDAVSMLQKKGFHFAWCLSLPL